MALANTATSYGSVTKTFHWLIALGILLALPLGYFANDLAHTIQNPDIATTESQVARATLLFSLHKTIGLTIFFVALARILWAVTQTKPGLLNGDTVVESRLAETVHWLLYGSLVIVPLSGWIHHASTTGFAPIWWPFGQSLPFVPKDEAVAQISSTLHFLLQWVLVGALVLHIVGALKHHVIDGDATLRRMLPGATAAEPTARQPGHALPFLGALVVWAVVLGGANGLGWFKLDAAQAPSERLATVQSDWMVQDGSLDITVIQMGSEVTGSFADWTAQISYDADAENPKGDVTVTVAIPSLTLGSVTDQAMGAEYFNAEAHPTAKFNADIVEQDGDHIAQGTLTIKGQSTPVDMPFDLTIEGDTAQASGGLTVDRRTFGIGGEATDSVAASVDIRFNLTATRQ